MKKKEPTPHWGMIVCAENGVEGKYFSEFLPFTSVEDVLEWKERVLGKDTYPGPAFLVYPHTRVGPEGAYPATLFGLKVV